MFPASYLAELGIKIEVDECPNFSNRIKTETQVIKSEDAAGEACFDYSSAIEKEIHPTLCLVDYIKPVLVPEKAVKVEKQDSNVEKSSECVDVVSSIQNKSAIQSEKNNFEIEAELSMKEALTSNFHKVLNRDSTSNSTRADDFHSQTYFKVETSSYDLQVENLELKNTDPSSLDKRNVLTIEDGSFRNVCQPISGISLSLNKSEESILPESNTFNNTLTNQIQSNLPNCTQEPIDPCLFEKYPRKSLLPILVNESPADLSVDKEQPFSFVEISEESGTSLCSPVDPILTHSDIKSEKVTDACDTIEELQGEEYTISISDVKSESVDPNLQLVNVLTDEIHIKEEKFSLSEKQNEKQKETLAGSYKINILQPISGKGKKSTSGKVRNNSGHKYRFDVGYDEPLVRAEIVGMELSVSSKPRKEREFNPIRICLEDKNPRISPITYRSSPNSSKQVTYNDVLHYIPKEGWTCDRCGKVFKGRSKLKYHKMLIHYQVDEFLCSICKAPFLTEKALKEHKKSHKLLLYKCPDCGQECSGLFAYERHYEQFHSCDGTSMFKCIDCSPSRCFYTKGRILLHMSRAHLMRRMPCEFCGKIITDKHMKKHRSIHTRKKHLKCMHCKMFFTSQDSLKNHIKTHAKKGKKEMCRFCGKFFIVRSSLVQHLHEKHTNEKNFECKECGKKFFSATNLDFHAKAHKEHRYICATCNRSFVHKHQLLSHIINIACTSFGR